MQRHLWKEVMYTCTPRQNPLNPELKPLVENRGNYGPQKLNCKAFCKNLEKRVARSRENQYFLGTLEEKVSRRTL